MAKFLKIENATLTQAATSIGSFLTAKINEKNVGLATYTFTDPAIEIIPTTPNFELYDSTFYDAATSYGVAVAMTINTSALCIPVFKLAEQDTSGGSIDIETVLSVGTPVLDVTSDSGSTYLNPKMEAYSDLILRIKKLLGWPTINLDICDENLSDYVDTAIELYSKYAGYTEEYLIFNTDIYEEGLGIKLDDLFSTTKEGVVAGFNNEIVSYDYDLKDHRKVIDCWSFEQGEGTGINTLFTLEQAMAQQTYFSYMLGSAGFDLISWDIMKGWLDTREKMLAQVPYFRFDRKTQRFTILPEPYPEQSYFGVIGAYVEAPIRYLMTEHWVYLYALALTKIAMGQVRGKFGGMVMFGGGTLNATDVLSQGLKEKEELEKQLVTGSGFVDSEPPKFFIG